MRTRWAVPALALLLAACGTTVDQAALQGGTAGSGLDGGLGGSGLPGTGTSGSAGVGTGGSLSSGSTSGGLGGTSTTGAGTSSTGTGGAAPGTTGGSQPVRPLAAKAPITLGFLVAEDIGKALETLGYSGQSSGDGSDMSNAITAYVNTRGGIAGHPLKAVVFEATATGGSNQPQQACARFFDDNLVDAVVGAYSDVVNACAKKAGVPFVGSGLTTVNRSFLAQNPQLAIPTHPVVENGATTVVDGLVGQGWFKPSSPTEVVKVGLITHEHPTYANVKPIVSARLKAAGLTLTDTFYMPFPKGDNDYGSAVSGGKSAALKFQSEGINRVVAVDEHGFGFGWFAIGAGGNGYYPKLGISSLSLPNFYTGLLTPRQLEGAAGVGWAPYIDTAVDHQPAVSPRTNTCLSVMKKAGQDTNLGNVRLSALSICEVVWTLADAWKTQQLGIASFTKGLLALGRSYQPVGVFGTDFARSRAAADAYRDISYQASCNCFVYKGGVKRFPR